MTEFLTRQTNFSVGTPAVVRVVRKMKAELADETRMVKILVVPAALRMNLTSSAGS
jgi:hypothetical protein